MASGVGSDAHYTVTGDSVNLASRLTDVANQDETILSQGVQMAISSEFELHDKGEIEVKGVAEPIRAYALLDLAGSERSQSERPFVGRQAELQQFTGILKACSEIKSGQVVYVRGEAGIGKTRLSAKFRDIASEMAYLCHRALVLDFGVSKQHNVVRTLVSSLISLSPDSAAQARELAVELACTEGLVDADQRVHLNALLNIPQPVELRSLYDAIDRDGREQGKIAIVTTLLTRLSARQPLLIFIEDIHWASESVIHLLAEVTKALADQASILVLTSRIEGDPLDHGWKQQTASTPLSTIDLRPLRPADAMALAADYFDASTRFAQQCVERADGNPLFLEQLLSSAEEIGEDQVPGSVHSIVQARLDSLQPVDKQAIQAASVLGQRFTLDDLRYMIGAPEYSCTGLVERYLVKPEGEAYLFSHALVQEAVYQSLLKSRRCELHRVAARWYDQREPELSAIHLDRAGDSGASRAYLEAARVQVVELNFESGLELANRGIELVETDEIKSELMLVRGEVLRNLGMIEDSILACRGAIETAQPGGQLCSAWLGLAQGLRVADQQDQALEALDSAQAIAVEHTLKSQLSRVHYLRGNAFFMTGDIEGCLAEHEKSLVLAEEVGSAEGMAVALGGLGDAYYLRGHMRSARDQFLACIALCQEHGFGQIEVSNRNMVGWSRMYLMEFSEAMKDALESIEMAKKVGHQRAEMIGTDLAGLIELERGNFAQARAYTERGLELSKILKAGSFVAQARFILARLDMIEGDRQAARKHIDKALQKVRELGTAFIGPAVLAVCAELADDVKQRAAYLQEAEDILDAGSVSHNQFHFARTAIDLGLQSHDWDAVERYALRLEAYTAEQALEWPDFMIARGRALAARENGDHSEKRNSQIQQLHASGDQAGLKLVLSALEHE
jgi:tetratricopeptide (TPR) repeat protein